MVRSGVLLEDPMAGMERVLEEYRLLQENKGLHELFPKKSMEELQQECNERLKRDGRI